MKGVFLHEKCDLSLFRGSEASRGKNPSVSSVPPWSNLFLKEPNVGNDYGLAFKKSRQNFNASSPGRPFDFAILT